MELQATTPPPESVSSRANGGEIRLSFKLFFVNLSWGRERRSHDRLAEQRRRFPVLTASHLPVLAGIWAAIFIVMYFTAVVALKSIVYFA